MPHNLPDMMLILLVAILAYGLGSIPFGLLLTALSGKGDIRSIGSGNIGATNVLRTGRKDIAVATLIFDSLKGAVAVWLAAWFCAPSMGQVPFFKAIAGVFAVLGHCFPVWLGFRGGKGVATGMGTLWGLYWPLGLVCTLIWLTGIKFSHISSVGALVAFFCAPLLMPVMTGQGITMPLPLAADLVALIIWIRHADNIRRLAQGSEPRICPPEPLRDKDS